MRRGCRAGIFSCAYMRILVRFLSSKSLTREDNQQIETYVGHTAGPFKVRYYNHTSSFRNPEHKHSTELSKYIWLLKQSNIQYSIRWKILKKCKAYSNTDSISINEKFL